MSYHPLNNSKSQADLLKPVGKEDRTRSKSATLRAVCLGKKTAPRTHPPHRAAQRFPTSTSGNVACSNGTILGAILFTKENPRVMQPCSTLWSLLYWNCSTCLFNCYDTTVLLPIWWLHNLYIERGTNIFFPGTKSADDQI